MTKLEPPHNDIGAKERLLTTLAALVVIESPPKKKEPHMTNSKMIAPVPL